MYFPTFNVYFEEINTKKEDNCCIICWGDDGPVVDLQIIIKDFHSCPYTSFFHKKCLQTWFSKNKYCPMCREKITNVELFTNVELNINSNTCEKVFLLCINYCKTFLYMILTYSVIYSPYILIFYTIKQLKNL